MKAVNILDGVLESAKCRLRPESSSVKAADLVVSRVNMLLKKARLKAECSAGGSYAKGVILKNDFDIDLFVRFDWSYREKDISGLLSHALKPLRPALVHGSRDYFQLKRDGILFEIIPVLRIEDYKKAVNVTDMSPLHVGYAKRHFDKKPALRDEVRLAKQFCKAARVYGAESYIRGFSGHVLDLLIIYYGSFEKLAMQATLWGERVVIDIEGHWKNPLQQLNTSKTISPLVIVDPIQPDRNAAAAVSREKFDVFRKAARAFLHKPSLDFFSVKPLDLAGLKKRAGNNWFVAVKASPLSGKDDVVFTKVFRVHELFGRELKKNGFKVLFSGWEHGGVCILYYAVKKEELSPFVLQKGPPVSDKRSSAAFRKRHKVVSVKSGILYAKEKRAFANPTALLKSLAKSPFVKEKVKSISFS